MTTHRIPRDESVLDGDGLVRFLERVIDDTIYESGTDYSGAVEDLFTQLHALGKLIGAQDLDEVSAFLRRSASP